MLIRLARERVSMALPVATLVLVLMVAFMVVLLVFILSFLVWSNFPVNLHAGDGAEVSLDQADRAGGDQGGGEGGHGPQADQQGGATEEGHCGLAGDIDSLNIFLYPSVGLVDCLHFISSPLAFASNFILLVKSSFPLSGY
jgi:hypothetical protein